jgi:hypothetical protein
LDSRVIDGVGGGSLRGPRRESKKEDVVLLAGIRAGLRAYPAARRDAGPVGER